MEWIGILAVIIGLLLVKDHFKRKREEKAARRMEITSLALKAQKECDKMSSLKTTTAQANAAGRALDLLNIIESYPEARDVVKNLDELRARLAAAQRVFPVVAAVEKAYKFKFKGKDKSELNALQDAVYQIRLNQVTNKDFNIAEVMPEGTGEILSIEGIERRCRELGWEPEH